MPKSEALKKKWAKELSPLEGKKIVKVRYMTAKEQEDMGWFRSPVVIHLDDSTLLWPSSDDEGNDAGALQIQPPEGSKMTTCAPTI